MYLETKDNINSIADLEQWELEIAKIQQTPHTVKVTRNRTNEYSYSYH
jgi:hypothetical protein